MIFREIGKLSVDPKIKKMEKKQSLKSMQEDLKRLEKENTLHQRKNKNQDMRI